MNEWLAQFPREDKAGNLRSWTQGLDLSPRLAAILRKVDNPDHHEVEVLRLVRRHAVLRVRDLSPKFPSIIVKAFPLGRLKSRLQFRKYGVAEVAHWSAARAKEIPVPEYFGYFEHRQLGLVKSNGVFMEDLVGYRSLFELLPKEPPGRFDLLIRAIPLLKRLFDSGVNHVDPSPQNMMVSADGSQMRMIDWEGCSFVAPRQVKQLVFQAAHFLNFGGVEIATPLWRDWLNLFHAACDCPIGRSRFQQAVAGLQPQGRLHLAKRLALDLGPTTEAALQGKG